MKFKVQQPYRCDIKMAFTFCLTGFRPIKLSKNVSRWILTENLKANFVTPVNNCIWSFAISLIELLTACSINKNRFCSFTITNTWSHELVLWLINCTGFRYFGPWSLLGKSQNDLSPPLIYWIFASFLIASFLLWF